MADFAETEYQIPQVAVRLVREPPLMSDTPIRSADDVISVMGDWLSGMDRELVCVVSLQTDGKPISMNVCSMGGLNEALVSPREVFKPAILSNANAMILIHNHPSGNLEPSKADISITDRIRQAGDILGIPLVDHVITGRGGSYYSFLEKDILPATSVRYADDLGRLDLHRETAEEPRKPYRSTSADRKKELTEITEQLEEGVKNLFESERYREYLSTMAKFHNYSFNNSMLIYLQNPNATRVAGYKAWQTNFNRHVKKGEKGIRILAPCPRKEYRETEKTDPETGEVLTNADGKPMTEKKPVIVPSYKMTTVFDVSQTEGEELPEITPVLRGDVKDYEKIFAAIQDVSPAKVEMGEIQGPSLGYYQPNGNRIRIREGMSQKQTVKTGIHELAHAVLHHELSVSGHPADRETQEVQAESVAYAVCAHYGIDTGSYSFGYIGGWSQGREESELKEDMVQVRVASSWIIDEMDKRLYPEKEKEASHTKEETSTREEKVSREKEKKHRTR